jgi:ElaA protein
VTLHVATFDQLDTATLYALLRLRAWVFVVEQGSPYEDLDGRDTEPDTRHVWLADGETPLAYLRIVTEDGGTARIGRVCVAASARGAGLAKELMRSALELIGPRPCVLAAQTYLTGFYEEFGFARTGPEFVEDGIPHLPMVRAARPPARRSSAAGR